MAAKSPSIVIIGGGIAVSKHVVWMLTVEACVLAIRLAEQGVKASIYERRSADEYDGGILSLMPNAVKQLETVGIYDVVQKQSVAFTELVFFDACLKKLATLTSTDMRTQTFPSLIVERSTLKQALLARLGELGVTVQFDMRCTKIEETEDSARATFEDETSVEADFVIGADGVNSLAREVVNPGIKSEYTGQIVVAGQLVRADLPAEVAKLPIPCTIHGQHGAFSFFPVGPGEENGKKILVWTTFNEPERTRSEWKKLAADKQQLREMLESRTRKPGWNSVISELCEYSDKPTYDARPDYCTPPLRTWLSKHRHIILIGDAAHAMSPASGMGGAMAMEDASTLSCVLTLHIAQGDMALHLQRWEKHRMARIEEINDITKRNMSMRQETSYTGYIFKSWSLWLMFKMPGITSLITKLYAYDADAVMKKQLSE